MVQGLDQPANLTRGESGCQESIRGGLQRLAVPAAEALKVDDTLDFAADHVGPGAKKRANHELEISQDF
jgi:hypothetical protein